jgi:type I restriction enzyme S subunit
LNVTLCLPLGFGLPLMILQRCSNMPSWMVLLDRLKRSAVVSGDILMAKIGSCGKTGIYPANMPTAMIPANLLKVTVNEYFLLKYVYNYFHSTYFQDQLKTIIKATAQPAFGITDFKKLPIPVAPLPEQHRIVNKIEELFTQLDAGVDLLQKTKVLLNQYRQSVLKAAFEGRLTEEWRGRNKGRIEPAERLLKRISKWMGENAPSRLKELPDVDTSGLHALPEGWAWSPLSCVGDVTGGLTKNAARNKLPLQLPYLRVANVYSARLELDDISTIGVTEGEVKRVLLEKGDLLIVEGNGSRDQIGRVALWDGSVSPCNWW